ncbi:acyl-CoA carboxylase epsilon subunit [Angustibacter sp. McL0619]|uniref:acyl-CoA carboxylase epsilon subunit n=1 Tax=Angustibacter sp. McL0619 TaxID=3415676 RepID=UPI003CEAE804
MSESPAQGPGPAADAVRVARGEPTSEELAALVVVLAASGDSDGGDPPPARSLWASGGRARTSPLPGAGAWRASGLPR